jgi:hypothetical protein
MAASIVRVTRRSAENNSTAIQQRITSGGNFDGTLPQATGPVRADSPLTQGNTLYKYPAAAKGGLFFWNARESVISTQLHVSLGAAGNVSVFIGNLDPAHVEDDSPTTLAGEDILIAQGTGVSLLALDETSFKMVLLPGQAIKLITTATAAAQIAQVMASLERTFVR